MSWALPVLVRKLIVDARQDGMTIKETAKVFKVCTSTVTKLMRRYKETGSLEPMKPMNGRKPSLSCEQLSKITETIQKQPDITLEEIKETLDLPISISRLCRIIKYKLKFVFKKNSVSIGAKAAGRSKEA